MDKYRCVWKEDFENKNGIDLERWEFSVGGNGWGNGELQYYTDNKKRNIEIIDGKLIIRSCHEKIGDNKFSSAKIISKNAWKYGKICVKAKMPTATGTWPAIWMLPVSYDGTNWPECGEIDIVEHFGHTTGEIFFSMHTALYNFYKINKYHKKINIGEKIYDYNIYELEWEKDLIRFLVNGNIVYEVKREKEMDEREWPFDKEFKLLINLAVGGYEAGKKGISVEKWPQEFIIDYVHVYQKKV